MKILEDSSLWIGLLLSIPLSIVGNMLTPILQRWYGKRSKQRSAKRTSELLAEFKNVEDLMGDPSSHQIYLQESVLFITILTSLVGVIVGVFFALASFVESSTVFTLAGRLAAIVGGVMVVKEGVVSLRKSNRVRNFDAYRARVESELKQLPAMAPRSESQP